MSHGRGQAVDEITEIPRLGEGRPPPVPEPPFGPDDDGPTQPPVSNAHLAMLLLIGTEMMFFAGLIGAFLVFRFGSVVWPPPFQPRLPVEVSGINTVILLFSGYTMRRALGALRGGNQQGLVGGLLVTALCGTIFLGVQGFEWVKLVKYGLTLAASGVYGSTFYTLIGVHGAHVFAALVWLLIVVTQARGNRFTAKRPVGVELCQMYWYFVVGLWPILYGLVYLV